MLNLSRVVEISLRPTTLIETAHAHSDFIMTTLTYNTMKFHGKWMNCDPLDYE